MRVTLKRQITALAALLLAVLMLAGCAPAASQPEPEEQQPLTLGDNGTTEFRLIYAAGSTDETLDMAAMLQREIQRLTGAKVEISEDLAYSVSGQSKEILLGSCDRAEDDVVFATLRSISDYRVQPEGNKLVIAANKGENLLQAVQELCLVLGDYTKDSKLELPADFVIAGGEENGLSVPALTGGTLRAGVDGGNGTELLIYKADKGACDAYLSVLETAGYILHAQNEIDGNRYFTCVGNGATVTVMDTPALGTVRVSVDPLECRLPTAAEPINAVVQPSVTLLGLEGYETNGSPTQTGLSMIYQLSDGSFIVVDGGHNKVAASSQIYRTMRDLSSDGKITVAAWIITHSHNDHAGAFISFRRNYASSVTVEKVLVNFPGEGQYAASDTGTSYRDNVLAEAAKLPGAEIVKVHPGQVFYLRDAKVEILYTMDLFEPDRLTDFNDSSIVCTVTLGGQKLLQTGDCGVMTSGILCRLYDEALKCDIVQMSHHGYAGATEELYQAVDPLYVLWPSGSTTYEKYQTAGNNVWLMTQSRMKRLWLAKDMIQTIMLPIRE